MCTTIYLWLPPWLLPAEKRCGTSSQAKLEPKPHQYMVVHPSALLPFAFFLLSSFDLFIVSRDLGCLLAALARLRHFCYLLLPFLNVVCFLLSPAEDEVTFSFCSLRQEHRTVSQANTRPWPSCRSTTYDSYNTTVLLGSEHEFTGLLSDWY